MARAAETDGRPLRVLPGIEITTREGVHLLAVFPFEQTSTKRTELKGWLDFSGDGDTKQASRRSLDDIASKVDQEAGVIIVPHPFTHQIGMLDSARKMSTKVDWLECGHVRLIQVAEDRVKHIARDEGGTWVNRYVLATARPQDIESSSYCLAPFNRSDAHRPEEIGGECSWFRMAEASVEGLKQVACEPRTRISRSEPPARSHAAILGLTVKGGYFDSETFRLSDGLTCVIGQNYAGKSSVLDFIRFALGQEARITDPGDKDRLVARLNGILQPGSTVEVHMRLGGRLYVARRVFQPVAEGTGPRFRYVGCEGNPVTYEYDEEGDRLEPVQGVEFPLEVYEQGRIGRLRDDAKRQLDMLDEFAGVEPLKAERKRVVIDLNQSAARLSPLHAERETLLTRIATLPNLERELAEKERHLPGEEEKKWARSGQLASSLDASMTSLDDASARLDALGAVDIDVDTPDIEILFGHEAPVMPGTEELVHDEVLAPWHAELVRTLKDLGALRSAATDAISRLKQAAGRYSEQWDELQKNHERETATRLSQAGVESPLELLTRVRKLREEIDAIKTKSQPRLVDLRADIDREETARETLVRRLKSLDVAITARRQEKAASLTQELNDQIKIVLRPRADDAAHKQVLQELTAQQRVHAQQLPLLTGKLSPVELADALLRNGKTGDAADAKDLCQICGVTEHTQTVLCRIADDIKTLNRLQTTPVYDVPEILVRRRGEQNYASLSELSPGEQSAALLMLALQTHSLPLIIDQPEDELGYDFVVHLVVPALLEAKGVRQIIVVTHNANISVLGDADYVLKLENRPSTGGGRHCSAPTAGAFEDASVTKALLELEGGQHAFRFRLHRYALPRSMAPDKARLQAPPGSTPRELTQSGRGKQLSAVGDLFGAAEADRATSA